MCVCVCVCVVCVCRGLCDVCGMCDEVYVVRGSTLDIYSGECSSA